MESVWWAFSEMYKKGLVYRGTKIMPFSTACNTVLSNFEAGSNYKDVSDPAVIVTFPTIMIRMLPSLRGQLLPGLSRAILLWQSILNLIM